MENLTVDDYQRMLGMYAEKNKQLELMITEYQIRLDKALNTHDTPTGPVEGDVVEDPTNPE